MDVVSLAYYASIRDSLADAAPDAEPPALRAAIGAVTGSVATGADRQDAACASGVQPRRREA